jgi:hypothetical protein
MPCQLLNVRLVFQCPVHPKQDNVMAQVMLTVKVVHSLANCLLMVVLWLADPLVLPCMLQVTSQ